jgi:hypothetical protein
MGDHETRGGGERSHSPSRQPPGRNGGIISHQPPATLSRRSAVYSIGPQRGHEVVRISGGLIAWREVDRWSHEEGEVLTHCRGWFRGGGVSYDLA